MKHEQLTSKEEFGEWRSLRDTSTTSAFRSGMFWGCSESSAMQPLFKQEPKGYMVVWALHPAIT